MTLGLRRLSISRKYAADEDGLLRLGRASFVEEERE